MYHITTETATQDGEFTDGDELNAIPPTDCNALWFNMIQRELLNVLAGVGITPDVSNFAQVWDVLQKVGMRCVAVDGATIDVTGFTGSNIVFHPASNFAFSGILKAYSLVIIVPVWTSESSEKITVTYNSVGLEIYKYNIFLGFNDPVNGEKLFGVQLRAKNIFGDEVVADEKFNSLEFTNVICNRIETFDGSVVSGKSDYMVMQLKEYWKVGQIKKIAYTGDQSSIDVPIYKNATTLRQVSFKTGVYKEFICIGFKADGNDEYAVLLVNGSEGL